MCMCFAFVWDFIAESTVWKRPILLSYKFLDNELQVTVGCL